MKNNRPRVREPLGDIKWFDMFEKAIPEDEEKQNGVEKFFEEIIAWNFPNLMKVRNLKIQDIQQTSCKIIKKMLIARNITGKLLKSKDEEPILKAARVKQYWWWWW